MTNDEQLDKARREAEAALARAKRRKTIAERLATGWKNARDDNGFREMLRRLPAVGEGGK